MQITLTSEQIVAFAGLLTALGVIYKYYTSAKKKVKEPVDTVSAKLDNFMAEFKKVNQDHERRIVNLEDRMGRSEDDRRRLHSINELTLTGLQALLGNDKDEIADAHKKIKEYMTKESA